MEYENIKDLFLYDPDTGLMIYSQNWTKSKRGKEIKTNFIWIEGVKYPVLRVIWVLMTKQEPISNPKKINRNKGKSWDNIALPAREEPEIDMFLQKFLLTGFQSAG